MKKLIDGAVSLLEQLIKTPSFSKEEDKTATLICNYLLHHDVMFDRIGNNVIAYNKKFDTNKKTVVLNSHHDTVKVVDGWSRDPFGAECQGDKIFGLGSNDAGASLVSLLATFVNFYDDDLPFNLMMIASAEEENSGENGVASVLSTLQFTPALAIVGEPTQMKMAIAEKGLLVLDGQASGTSGHVAHQQGENAIYKAIKDIEWIRSYQFPKVSETLGQVLMSVTQIDAGYQHNIIPDTCHFVVDVRINECYTLHEVYDIIKENCDSEIIARSLRWHPSKIDKHHPIVQRGIELGLEYYGSGTMSDQVHFSCSSLKIGPGDSLRSHTADEYIVISEIVSGIETYIKLLDGLSL